MAATPHKKTIGASHAAAPARLTLATFIVLLGATFYLYEYFLRVMPTVITQDLTQDFSLSPSTLGHFLATFFYAYALMQVPAGLICDQIGPKRSLTIAVMLCALATLVFQATDQIWIAFLCRLLIGSASAFAFIAPLKLASCWFSADKQALITGVVQLMGCAGAVFAGPPIAQLVDHFGWRSCLFVSGIVGLVLASLYQFFLADAPSHTQQPATLKRTSTSSPLKQTAQRLVEVLSMPQSWSVGVVAFSVWAPVAIFAESWGIPYLSLLQNITVEQASQQVVWVWLGMAVVSPLAGWLSNACARRKAPCLLLLAMGLIASLILTIHPPQSFYAISFCCFLIGCAASAQPVTFGMVFDHNQDRNLGTAIALNNMLLMSSCSVLQPTVGYFLQALAGHANPMSLAMYQQAFLVVPATITLGMLACYFLIPESYCVRTAQTPSLDTAKAAQSAELDQDQSWLKA